MSNWINILNQNKIPYYLIDLKTDDYIIIDNKNSYKTCIINFGIIGVYRKNSHTNNILAIFNRGNLFTNESISIDENNFYYELRAIKTSSIIILKNQIFLEKIIYNQNLWQSFFHSYQKSLAKYIDIMNMMKNRDMKRRLIFSIFLLSQYCGKYTKQGIVIPCQLSHKSLSIIIGSNRVTVTRILNNLKNTKLITFNKKKIIISNITILVYSINI